MLISLSVFFKDFSSKLIIEFVPKEDSQVQRLLATREDVFPDYNEQSFVEAFTEYFDIKESIPIDGTSRKLFVMIRHT